MRENLTKRFFKYVKKTSTCWLWTGGKLRRGYGQFHASGEIQAHRVSYKIHIGKIPEKLIILHKCDNPSCVNPEHLIAGTQKQNIEDSIRKGRFTRGEKVWKAKLSPKKISEIRNLRMKFDVEIIAKKFNVSKSTIRHIFNGYTWCHVN